MIRIGDHNIGPGYPTFIVAEMSGNHGGNLSRALELVRAAKRCGADAIKLQTYTADTITLKCDRDDFLITPGSPWEKHKTLWELYNEAHTPWGWHETIFNEARKIGLEIFSSPFDQSAVEMLEKLKVPAYKIASPEITDVNLLDRVARTRKPIIISTGISDLGDIELALSILRGAGAAEIIVLKCTTAYPAPIEDTNLRTIPDIISRFDVVSGLSDHTHGTAAAVASVALGGKFIEKHLTLNDSRDTVDSFFSSTEEEFSRMVTDIRLVEKALGDVSYKIATSALPNLRGRRSLYVSAPIKAGEQITKDNIKSVRPSFGLHPRHYNSILGRFVKCDLEVGDRLVWDIIEE